MPPPNPSCAAAREPPSIASPSPRRPSGAPQASEEHPGVSCSCSRAPLRPHALTAVRRMLPSASMGCMLSSLPDRSSWCPRSVVHVVLFVPVPSALKSEPLARDRRSSPERCHRPPQLRRRRLPSVARSRARQPGHRI
jgi:hypothetical protein